MCVGGVAELQSRQDSLVQLQEETERLHSRLQQTELDKESQLTNLKEELLSQTQQLDSCQARVSSPSHLQHIKQDTIIVRP